MDKLKLNVLDVGSGTGHWLEFYNEFFDCKKIIGIDYTDSSISFLKNLLSDKIEIYKWDVSSEIHKSLANKKFEIINAIGVIFHIVDDKNWFNSIRNFSNLLADNGLLFIGGDFGHKSKERGIMRKSRSIYRWKNLINKFNLEIASLKRYNWWAGADNNGITDNLLVLKKNKSIEGTNH